MAWSANDLLFHCTLVILIFRNELTRRGKTGLRTFLGSQGMKKGALSKFIEEAVRRRVLQRVVGDIRSRNAAADPDEVRRIVNESVSAVRAKRRVKRLAKTA